MATMDTKVIGCYVLCILVAIATADCPEDCMCPNSEQLSCVGSGLTAFPQGLASMPLTSVDLTDNDITLITIESLLAIRDVVNLKLTDNDIETIEDGALHVTPDLQTLDLAGNSLSSVHQGTFSGGQSLLTLDVSNNLLDQIDGAFASMSQLTRLDVRDNRITRLTQFTFRDLTSLRYLLLSGNQISHIDKRTFKNLSKLMYLVLKGNPLGNADNIEFNSQFLSYIDLSETGLRYVPRGLPNSVRYLQLRRNNMSVINIRDLRECPYVSILVLDENGITYIEDGTFEPMIYLQQLWLNGNKLTKIPFPLPASLQRLLMDANHLGAISNVFPPMNSKLNTLSFMGNNITYISPDSFYKLSDLTSLDFSNNKIQSIYSDTFLNSTKLKTLHLSKNPIKYLYSRSLHGLYDLRTLTLAYISTNTTVHKNSFQSLTQLKGLDIDASPSVIASILNSETLLKSLKSVEDLSIQSSELSHLRSDFPTFFPNLQKLHLSSGRWHCDMSMLWLKQWLESTSVEVADVDSIACFTPRNLHGKSVLSLDDDDFVPTTSTISTTQLRTFPPAPQPTSSSLVKGQGQNRGQGVTKQDFHFEGTTLPPPAWWDGSGFNPPDDSDEDDGELLETILGNNNKFTSNEESAIDNAQPETSSETWDLLEDFWGTTRRPAKHRHGNRHGHHSNSNNNNEGVKYGSNDIDIETIYISTLPNVRATKTPNSQLASKPPNGKDYKKYGPKSLLVIIATTVSTILFIAVLITAIVFACKRKRKKEVYHNAIKYQQKNDVLYFMPNGMTQLECSGSDSVPTTTSREKMALVPGRDINHEGPLRIYKWEDF